ncbi:uncharacterized protein AMSG_09130 [Thecamonas trahens ATCC 50062]|uniref:ADP-ribosylation factor-like protein 2-binding protein n=1 Tax=Thecamonas trahens ATCC 50062 TaxID=461836 RepID=A0A0L0DKQ5_THETB|nr:hypothetical protein AMSG_09130 [Thecamonas trahens ATCC 50062]KNC52959.1 hypothetical protein AMSG_09130 [Thecamonas trahens ATCC 50062]|eukprot:XP_013754851.1 hypothetical protein AMSG_09130 [Thecamonas trahens ATCC 50062]
MSAVTEGAVQGAERGERTTHATCRAPNAATTTTATVTGESAAAADVVGEGTEIDLDLGFGECAGESAGEVDAETARFDALVGELEDAIMDPAFGEALEQFRDAHCEMFDDGEENKLEYMPLFSEWQAMVEGMVAEALAAAGSSMAEFMSILATRDENELQGEVFELLMACGDFEAFKDEMLAHKAAVTGATVQLSLDITGV